MADDNRKKLLRRARALRRQLWPSLEEDRDARFEFGDLLEALAGERTFEKMCEEIGIPVGTAKPLRWLAREFPPGSALRRLPGVGWHHMRLTAALEEADRERLLKALSHNPCATRPFEDQVKVAAAASPDPSPSSKATPPTDPASIVPTIELLAGDVTSQAPVVALDRGP